MSFVERKAVITAGPTREWIDPVRFISNPSSGKMGAALADSAFPDFRETVLIHGPVDGSIVSGRPYRTVSVETTEEMLEAVKSELEPGCVLIMSAAPADYAPLKVESSKIKKGDETLTLTLKKTPDILKEVAAMRAEGLFPGMITVGFAAETDNTEAYALGKLKDKDLDMICLNDVSKPGAGFGSDTNIITVFQRNGGRYEIPLASKVEAASEILRLAGLIEREAT